MVWLIAILLALVVFVLLAFWLRAPRSGWEVLGAALLLGLAGFAWQASPDIAGAPKQAAGRTLAFDPVPVVEARDRLRGPDAGPKDRLVMVADGYARNGRFADAAEVLRGVVEKNPKNADAWLALGNALVAHAEGLMTPPAAHAYRRAALADPGNPGPAFFIGLGLAQSGKFIEARATWAGMLENAPEDAPWRAEVEARIERLDQLLAMQAAAALEQQ